MLKYFIALMAAMVLFGVGCTPPNSVAVEVNNSAQKIDEELLESDGVTVLPKFGELSLVPDNESEYFAGMPAVVKIVAKNMGDSELNLATWYAREQDNLIFHYTPCDADGQLFDPAQAWTTQRPVINTPVYYPLVLMPGNTVEASAELEFIGKLPEGTKSGYYLMVIQLNNPDVELKTLPFVIAVSALDISDVQLEIQ